MPPHSIPNSILRPQFACYYCRYCVTRILSGTVFLDTAYVNFHLLPLSISRYSTCRCPGPDLFPTDLSSILLSTANKNIPSSIGFFCRWKPYGIFHIGPFVTQFSFTLQRWFHKKTVSVFNVKSMTNHTFILFRTDNLLFRSWNPTIFFNYLIYILGDLSPSLYNYCTCICNDCSCFKWLSSKVRHFCN